MVLNFEKLNSNAASKQTDPRKLFTTLRREPRFKRPLDEQSDVLDRWYIQRTAVDTTLKMNTGAGKTVVGLLCLQSSLNEGVYPAIYITPDKYLTQQVLTEAQALGIDVATDPRDPNVIAGRAILVDNIHTLVNGRSKFGVGKQGRQINIGAMVIDDAHACLITASEQFQIKCNAGNSVYDGILELFKSNLKQQSAAGILDIEVHDPQTVMEVPYWAWQSKIDDVMAILHTSRTSNELEWSWPLLKDVVPLCSCFFGGGRLAIVPKFIPIEMIPSFAQAKRRIYMTATLADDTILVSHFGASAKDILKPIRGIM